MSEIGLLWSVISFIFLAVIGGIVKFYTYKAEQDARIAELNNNITRITEQFRAQKEVVDHLTRAGEGLKIEFGDMRVMIGEIKMLVKSIEKSLKVD